MQTSKHTIQGFLESLLTIFKRDLKGVKKLELYSGQFSPEQLRKISVNTPAVLVSLLDIKDVRSAPTGREVTLNMACFVLVGNLSEEGKPLCKNLAILPFVESILAILDESENWKFIQLPEKIQADNLFSSTGVQVAVWVVKWEQTIPLGTTEESLEGLHDFLRAGVRWETEQPEQPEQQEQATEILKEDNL